VNGSGQSLYKKSGGTPTFNEGTVTLTGARFTIGEAGKDLDLSRPYTISFDVIQAGGSGKIQIFVDSASTSGTRIFNENASTLVAGQRFVLNAATGTATSFIQIRAESSATLTFDNLVIEYTGAAGSSSSASSTGNTGTSSSAGSSVVGGVGSSSSSVPSSVNSSSSSEPYIPVDVNLSADCISLATNPNVNWRETGLQTDQEIVECLYESLGSPVGYGENAKGGFDPNGNSKLTIITKSSSTSVEQQLLDALTDNAHNWVVFDKTEFANEHEIGMYRMYCANPTVLSMLDATETECIDYWQWCARKGFNGEAQCRTEFFNKAMNNKNIPIRIPAVGSNKTIDGRMSKAYFMFSGFAIGKDSDGVPTQTSTSVIFTHLDFRGAGHTEDHYVDPDMIRSTGFSSDIWIHKNTFDTTGDSAFDVKIGAHNITMSFNRLVNVKRAVLHGSSDSRTINEHITTTMHHNAFVTTDDSYKLLGNTLRRVPLLRRGKTHMFNNVFINYRKEILSLRVGAQAFLEDNAFVVNILLKEKSSIAASLNEIHNNYFKDVSGGSLRNDRNVLWFGSGTCVVDDTTKTVLTTTNGTVADLSQNYNAASLNMINGWRFDAGQDLVDYVTLTAGKYGDQPFNSPLSPDRVYMEALSPTSCQ
jgi:pectate lyase